MTKELLYGVAYYDEYMPYERLETDIVMMKAAGINLVRIAESTWSTHEPQNGVFDFTSVDRVLNAMHEAGIKVIVGTPTYAVPTWMVKEHPDVLAETPNGPGRYGARQIMDITHPVFLFYAERMIRKLMKRVYTHPAVIGYQIDNETKHYHTSGPNVQLRFVKYLQEKFGTLESLNRAFGLDYWSNRINSWEDFPSVVGTINGSLGAEFSRFQRKLVTQFLAWQASIVNEYKKSDQFITHNFDFEWRGYSFGVQPDVNHYEASKAVDIAGVDIYHPSQGKLTGTEISFGGDSTRSLKGTNYFVLETQAQAFPDWTPYPGQLRLQAFSHLASGANMVEYWHWHSIHNSFETYWKGLLSHDLKENPTYNEAKTIGADFKRLSSHLVNLRKTNKVAILVSNDALTGMEWFPLPGKELNYNDIVRLMYDSLYEMNIGCDVIDVSVESFEKYELIVVPSLYVASDERLEKLNEYVRNGGHVVYTFKSGFSNENSQVRTDIQPGIISEVCGVQYSQFVEPEDVTLKNDPFDLGENHNSVHTWMELLQPTTAEVLAWYDHPHWGEYAAITTNQFEKGRATYIGCIPSPSVIKIVLERTLKEAGVWGVDQALQFPLIVKSGVNDLGRTVRYYFNYSEDPQTFVYSHSNGQELLENRPVESGQKVELERWGVAIIEEQ
ncbi:beta-galactosidase [Litchfieldia salsa]|uniref:Beta-galactosidase n=1 Tax=Litchfieldia salsa TaxID=930152 RepID=A0A1H0X2Q2_9BACI|nr:beta-galactosidase [Litchfieldia salsa]SDP97160.1 beta-galactosidase [Litchfieldia salsa]